MPYLCIWDYSKKWCHEASHPHGTAQDCASDAMGIVKFHAAVCEGIPEARLFNEQSRRAEILMVIDVKNNHG